MHSVVVVTNALCYAVASNLIHASEVDCSGNDAAAAAAVPLRRDDKPSFNGRYHQQIVHKNAATPKRTTACRFWTSACVQYAVNGATLGSDLILRLS